MNWKGNLIKGCFTLGGASGLFSVIAAADLPNLPIPMPANTKDGSAVAVWILATMIAILVGVGIYMAPKIDRMFKNAMLAPDMVKTMHDMSKVVTQMGPIISDIGPKLVALCERNTDALDRMAGSNDRMAESSEVMGNSFNIMAISMTSMQNSMAITKTMILIIENDKFNQRHIEEIIRSASIKFGLHVYFASSIQEAAFKLPTARVVVLDVDIPGNDEGKMNGFLNMATCPVVAHAKDPANFKNRNRVFSIVGKAQSIETLLSETERAILSTTINF